MIERVARAIATSKRAPKQQAIEIIDKVWPSYVGQARAAIEAMRDLTDSMAEEISKEANCCGGVAYNIWSNAIDEALK